MTGRYVFLLIGVGLQKRFVFDFLVFACLLYSYTRTATAATAATAAVLSATVVVNVGLLLSIDNRPLPWWMAITAWSLTAYFAAALVVVALASRRLLQCLLDRCQAVPS